MVATSFIQLQPTAAKRAPQLVPDLPLKGFKRSGQQLGATGLVLLTLGEPIFGRRALHAHENGFVGRAHAGVTADIHRLVQFEAREIRTRCIDGSNPESLEGTPVLQRHARIHQRCLDQLVQRRLLRLGQFGTQMRDHHVPAREHTLPRCRPIQATAARVDHFDALAAEVANSQCGAVQANARCGFRAIEF